VSGGSREDCPEAQRHCWNWPQAAPIRDSRDSVKGLITVTLDRGTETLELEAGARQRGARYDRFGIVTSWVDGNSQDVYWDDVTYTVGQ
jgi:hypothetical protein